MIGAIIPFIPQEYTLPFLLFLLLLGAGLILVSYLTQIYWAKIGLLISGIIILALSMYWSITFDILITTLVLLGIGLLVASWFIHQERGYRDDALRAGLAISGVGLLVSLVIISLPGITNWFNEPVIIPRYIYIIVVIVLVVVVGIVLLLRKRKSK